MNKLLSTFLVLIFILAGCKQLGVPDNDYGTLMSFEKTTWSDPHLLYSQLRDTSIKAFCSNSFGGTYPMDECSLF